MWNHRSTDTYRVKMQKATRCKHAYKNYLQNIVLYNKFYIYT